MLGRWILARGRILAVLLGRGVMPGVSEGRWLLPRRGVAAVLARRRRTVRCLVGSAGRRILALRRLSVVTSRGGRRLLILPLWRILSLRRRVVLALLAVALIRHLESVG